MSEAYDATGLPPNPGPGPMSNNARVFLKPRRARPFFARHPWVFDSSIERVVGAPRPVTRLCPLE